MAGILRYGFGQKHPNDADLILYTRTIRSTVRRFIPTWVDKFEAKARMAQPDAGSRWLASLSRKEKAVRRVPELDLVMGPQHANRLQDGGILMAIRWCNGTDSYAPTSARAATAR